MHKESTLQNEHDSKPVDSAYLADMPIQSTENEQLDEFEVAQEKPIFTYLKKHIEAFDPTPKEYKFIDKKLDLKDGKVAVDGLLIWVIFKVIFITLISFMGMIILLKDSIFAASLVGVSFAVNAMMLYYFSKKKKRAILLYRAVNLIGLTLAVLSIFRPEPRTTWHLINYSIWSIYSFKSIRLKYTMVED